MEDIKRVWTLFVAGLHAGFVFLDYFATTAPVALGIVLIVLAGLVKLYQKRRRFYAGLDVAADWRPSYGSLAIARVVEMALSVVFSVVLFLGVMCLFQHYLPVLFEDIVGFCVRLTG